MSTSSQTADLAAIPESLPAWKKEINARLSAHRTRRGAFASQQPSLPGIEAAAPAARAARVAARVAERYAKAPTYSEMLAAEAAKAARAAEAAAHAAREAHQAAQAFNDVLWAGVDAGMDVEGVESDASQRAASAPEAPQYRVDPASLPAQRRNEPALPELRAAVEPHPQIVDPFEDALVAPAQPLPARVLEFPRELVAARKARPRLAEGPLRDAGADSEAAQLRIFEVDPEAISHQPASASVPAEDAAMPEWSSIRLDATPHIAEAEMYQASEKAGESMPTTRGYSTSQSAPFSARAARSSASQAKSVRHSSSLDETLLLHVAPMEDRIMAAIVDTSLTLCAFLLFVLVFAACTIHPPTGKPAAVAAAIALVSLGALYQWLFFTYAEATPGMRYARIALCTFDDENPGRKTLQHRVGALFLAALPLGLGFLWALLDDDRLGWHDRMTRTYQRSYR